MTKKNIEKIYNESYTRGTVEDVCDSLEIRSIKVNNFIAFDESS